MFRPGGGLSWRRLRALVVALPLESQTRSLLPVADAASASPVEQARPRWSQTDWLMADLFDVVAVGNWIAARDPNARPPEPYPRPGVPIAARAGLTAEQLHALRRRTGRPEEVDER